MCGIFGFWLDRPLTDDDVARGTAATARLAHRGPDGSGVWSDRARGLFLGHRRLAILDLSDVAAQPMARDGATIIFNGEIYNFADLRAELVSAGESFRSNGDTEVLLAGWRRQGEAVLDRLDGMFAFAVADDSGLTLATDPFGEKPLYVARTAEGVYFASEPQVLTQLLGLAFAPTPSELAQFLALGFIPATATGFPGLESVGPATVLRFDAPDRPPCQRRYWSPPRAGAGGRPIDDAALDRVEAALTAALERRLHADVPVGVFLSAGVDSSLVAALAARRLDRRVDCFTVAFPDGRDESGPAAEIARHLGLPHTIIDSAGDDRPEAIPADLALLYGVPNDNTTAISVRRMSAAARRHITVALSGTGGDELAYGYNKYAFLYRNRLAYRLPAAVTGLARPLAGLLPRLGTLARLLAGDDNRRIVTLKNGPAAEALIGLAATLPGLGQGGRDLMFRLRDFDLDVTMPGSYIPAIDRGSMRAGLEVRTPFLCRAVFEEVAQLDQVALLTLGGKALLRRLLARHLPRALVDRPKQGFVMPIARWTSTLAQPPAAGPLPAAALDRLWHRRADSNAGSLLLRLAVLEQFAS